MVTTLLSVTLASRSDEYLCGRVPRGRDFLGPLTGQDFLSANLGRGARLPLPDRAAGRQHLVLGHA